MSATDDKTPEERAEALIEESCKLLDESFNCVAKVFEFYNERNEAEYKEFRRNPYRVLAREFGQELSTVDYDELSALVKQQEQLSID